MLAFGITGMAQRSSVNRFLAALAGLAQMSIDGEVRRDRTVPQFCTKAFTS